jgi:hypothetical protein
LALSKEREEAAMTAYDRWKLATPAYLEDEPEDMRQEVAELIEKMPQGMDADDFLVELVSRAVAIEREACAEVCDEVAGKYRRQHYPNAQNVAYECSAAIRVRGEK